MVVSPRGAVYPFTGKTFSLNSLLGRCDCFYDFAKYFWRKSGSLKQRYVKRHASGRSGAEIRRFYRFFVTCFTPAFSR